MKKVDEFIEEIIQFFRSKGLGQLLTAGDVVIFELGGQRIRVRSSSLSRELVSRINAKFYSRVRPMTDVQILRAISHMLDTHMFPELINIDRHIEKLMKKLQKPQDRIIFRNDPPGRVHFRFISKRKKYLFVSDLSANSECLHEAPLIAKLRRCWPFGKILNNFCLLHEHRHGWDRIFELDAIAIHNTNLFIFELKHRRYTNPLELLRHLLDAGRRIRRWQNKLGNDLNKIIPIVYFRKNNIEKSQFLNHIFFENLPEQFAERDLLEFRAFSIEKDIAESQIMELIEPTIVL